MSRGLVQFTLFQSCLSVYQLVIIIQLVLILLLHAAVTENKCTVLYQGIGVPSRICYYSIMWNLYRVYKLHGCHVGDTVVNNRGGSLSLNVDSNYPATITIDSFCFVLCMGPHAVILPAVLLNFELDWPGHWLVYVWILNGNIFVVIGMHSFWCKISC